MIAANDDGGGLISLTFDQPITANPAGVPDTSMAIDAAIVEVDSAAQTGPNTVQVLQGLDPSNGFPLTWAGQPLWIVESIDISTSTMIT